MPNRMKTGCRYPGCGNLARGRYCTEHAGAMGARRLTSAQKGYGAEWRKTRAIKLRLDPLCEECGKPAVDVDHKVAKRRGGSDALDNLRSLCKSCHSVKTVHSDGGFGRSATGGGIVSLDVVST